MSVTTTPVDASPRTLASAGLPRRVRKSLEHALSLVSTELDASLGLILGELEQELFRLAGLARDPGSESAYMQILRTLRLNRSDLIPRFMLELEAGLAAVRTPPAPAAPDADANRVNFRNLSLVEDTVMDEWTVLREIATRQESRAALPLHLLGQRFGVLAGAPAFDAERIPLGPQALCRAMRSASETLQITYDARLLLYRIFEQQVMAKYPRVLEQLDAAMDEEGILRGLNFVPVRARPSLRTQVNEASEKLIDLAETAVKAERQSGSAGQASDSQASHSQASHSQASDSQASHSQAPHSQAPHSQPVHSVRTSESQRPYTTWMGEPDQGDGVGDESEAASLAVIQKLMSGRHALISKLRPSHPGGLRQELSTQDVFAALGTLQSQPASASTSQDLRDIKQTLLAQARQQRGQGAALSQRDNDTFELISMLYGQIESEIRADAPAAALIRRLQLPLLRVALQDRAFFVRGRHPARQLLNTVAESAAKWLDKDDYDPQMLLPLQQAVTHVVENYDGDDAVFDAGNAQLQTHLQEQVRKAELLERRHVEAARGKEKLEVAKQRAVDTLNGMIGDQRLAKFVRALLNQAWADVLTLTLLRQGEDSESWRRQVEVTREIIHACSHDDTPDDPKLTAHVATALAQVGYHVDEAGVIAQRLTSRMQDDKDDPASRTELAMKLKARARLGESPAKTRRPKLPPRTPEEQARYEQLRVMPFGAWIEFVINQQGDVVRRRMSWFSPITDNALFVNQRGQRVGEQTLDSLARMLAGDQARIVTAERGHLVDRAWQAAVSALRSFAGRGDGASLLEST